MFFVAIGSAFGLAIVGWPFLRIRGKIGPVVAIFAASTVLLCPFWIPPDRILARALAALPSIECWFKMIDYARQNRAARDRAGFAEYLRFLIPFPVFMVKFGSRDRRPSTPVADRCEIIRIMVAAIVVAICFLLVFFQITAIPRSIVLDHVVKMAMFVLTIEGISQALYGIERLARFDTRPLMRNLIVSRTVADFWSRYNTRVHTWLIENVFRPSGGRHAPVRGVLAAFFVSGVFHELMFGIATSRFDGFQFSFFMIQAPAVLASPSLERFARRNGMIGNVAVRGLSIAFMLITSMLFFHGVNRVFPFLYASR